MPAIELRPYQQRFIDDVRSLMSNGQRRICGVAPCGAGKTIIAGWIIRETVKNSHRAIFFVHRKELIDQTSAAFTQLGIPHGIIAADAPQQLYYPVQIASVQTLVQRLHKIPAPDLLVCDECHHVLANSYRKILDAWPSAYLIGLTATPERTSGIGLGDVFTSIVEAATVTQLIELGNLTDYRYFAPSEIDTSHVHTRFGEFVNTDLATLMSERKIIGKIVENYNLHAAGKSAICYCVNIEHSQLVAAAFNDAGIPAAHCDGETPKPDRQQIVADFRAGDIKVLCNAELFGEGFDVPNAHAVILARPTQSQTLHIQQSMRSMRPDPADPDKIAVIIDHVSNYKRHGQPKTPRVWSLDSKTKEKRIAPTKTCPRCGCVNEARTEICQSCGYEFPKAAITAPDLTEYDGTLAEINSDIDTVKGAGSTVDTGDVENRTGILLAPRTIEDFLEVASKTGQKRSWAANRALEFAESHADALRIARACGYKDGWAWYRWTEKKRRLAEGTA